MKKILFFCLILFALVCRTVGAAPAECELNTTGEVAYQYCDTNQYLMVDVATGTIQAVNTIASGTVQIKDNGIAVLTKPTLTATFDYATASVSAAATGTFTATAVSTSMLIVNESSTQTVRFCVGCILNTTCTFAAAGGIGLVAGGSFAMDGVSVSAVNYCNPAGAPANISVQWGRKP